MDRPDWGDKFDASGAALVPAVSSDDTHAAMMRGDAPTAAQSAAILGTPATTSAPIPAKSDGKLTRQDWTPDRNESGQFVSKSESALRQMWDREGGAAAAVQRVLATEQNILSLSDDPAVLQTAIDELPKDIALKAADVFRLSPPGFNREDTRIGQFLESLSEGEFQSLKTW